MEDNCQTSKKDWFFRNQHLVSDKTFIIVIAVGLVVHIFSGILVQYIIPIDGDCLTRQQYLEIFWIGIYGTSFLIVIATFLRVRDPFYIKFELFWTQVMCGNFVLIFALLVLLRDMLPGWEGVRYYFYAAAVITGFLLNGVFPVVLSFVMVEGKFKRTTSENSIASRYGVSSYDELFKMVTQNEFLLDQFQAYAVKGWFVENVLFLRSVDHYRAIPEANREEAVRGMVDNFLGDAAALMINIDETLRIPLLEKIKTKQFTLDLFDEVQEIIRQILKEDGFMKWKDTEEFRAAMEVVEKQ